MVLVAAKGSFAGLVGDLGLVGFAVDAEVDSFFTPLILGFGRGSVSFTAGLGSVFFSGIGFASGSFFTSGFCFGAGFGSGSFFAVGFGCSFLTASRPSLALLADSMTPLIFAGPPLTIDFAVAGEVGVFGEDLSNLGDLGDVGDGLTIGLG